MSGKFESGRVMFHGKHGYIGYCAADSFCKIFPAIASDKVKRGIKGYGNTVFS